MRAILIVVIILLLAILIPPYWFGMKAENEYNKLTENMSRFENIKIQSKTYKRGWLTSNADITYSIKDEDLDSVTITEKDKIYHGIIPVGLILKGKYMLKPVLAVIESQAVVKSESVENYAQIINTLPQISLKTTLSLNGSGTSEVSIAQVDQKLKDGKIFKWSGLDGLINFNEQLDKVSSVFNSGDLIIEDDTFRLSVKGINIESNLDFPAYDYKNPLGNLDITIGEFSSEGKEGDELNKVTMTNLEIGGSTHQKGNLLNHSHSLGFETLNVSGNIYGPGIYELEIRNIDKSAFERVQRAISRSENSEGVLVADQLTAELIKILPALFKSSPEIELTKLSIKTGEGEIDGYAIISVNGEDLDNPELATNPIFLLAAVSAVLNISVSKTLMDNLLKDYKVEEITDDINSRGEKLPSEKELQELARAKAQSEIQDMLDQKVLILQNGKYQLEASYGLGQIKLNGNPLDINSLLNL